MSNTDDTIRSRVVAREISQQIVRGEIAVGSYLPSTRALASQYGVSLGTVQVALRELQTQSLIECLPRRGSIVRMACLSSSNDSSDEPPVRPSLIGVAGARITDFHPVNWGHGIIRAAGQSLFDAHFTMAQLPWFDTDGDFKQAMISHLDRLGDSLAGVLTWATPEIVPMLSELDRRNIPWITFSRGGADFPHNFVEADNLGSMRLMGKCCALSGAHRVLHLTSSVAESINAMNKATGFYQGFLEAGVSTRDIDLVTVTDITEAGGYDAVQRYLAQGKMPQVIVAFGDMLGAGAERALSDAGIRIPEQVGVIGGTGTVLSEQSRPSLTVVAQPMQRMGTTAAEMLSDMVRDGTRRLLGRQIPCELIFRDSFPMPPQLADEVRRYNAGGVRQWPELNQWNA